MLQNYLLIALRNLRRNPLYSFIKIAGLSVGAAGCLVIFLLTNYELGFDRFQPDRDRIYRIYSEFSGLFDGVNRGVPIALPSAVRSSFTGLEATTRFHTYSSKVHLLQEEKKEFGVQKNSAIVDSDYFKVFDFYQWTSGSANVLNHPFNVVLTEDKALTYFGTAEPDKVIGQRIYYHDSLELTVAGLVKTVTQQTDLHFTDFISYPTIEKSWLKENYNEEDWNSTNSSTQCFIKLLPGTPLQKTAEQMTLLDNAYKEKNADEEWRANYKLQSLSDLHFNVKLGTFDNGNNPADMKTLRTLIIVALLLLLIAAINFINLETAQSVRRAKEVGLRKVMGSSRAALIRHFLTESTVLTSIAILIAIPLAKLALVLFDEFLPKGNTLNLFAPSTLLFLLITIAVIAVAAGIYPAFVLSSFLPAAALKNQVANSRMSRSAQLRKVLTVFQFSFSQLLIVGTIIMGWQINYMLNKDMGFRKDAIINIYTPWYEKSDKVNTFQNELAQIAGITGISRNGSPPAQKGYSTNGIKYKKGTVEIPLNVHQRYGDTSYLSVYDIKLIAGRNVQPVDSAREMLVNRALCKKLGFDNPADIIGEVVIGNNDKPETIVGVLEDFHFQSLHHTIEPLAYRYESESSGFAVRLATNGEEIINLKPSLDAITAAWKKIYPDSEFKYTFLDESIRNFYENEKRTAKLVNTGAALTIFISCLGLFGLASFTATQRTKEIGIRKVLGATAHNIVALLSKEFIVLVMIAFVIAAPAAWYAASQWLDGFAYRTPLGWPVFALGGIASLLVALLTISYQSLKAAWANPVDSIRYE